MRTCPIRLSIPVYLPQPEVQTPQSSIISQALPPSPFYVSPNGIHFLPLSALTDSLSFYTSLVVLSNRGPHSLISHAYKAGDGAGVLISVPNISSHLRSSKMPSPLRPKSSACSTGCLSTHCLAPTSHYCFSPPLTGSSLPHSNNTS